MSARVGVDVGGTFTDVVVVEDGELTVDKRPSTPADPADGVLSAVESITDDGVAATEIDWIGHGTTVATNAVLEETWAETALVTTAGCRDVLEIGRQHRRDLYDLTVRRPPPIVPRDRRFTVAERLDERGGVLTEPDERDIESAAGRILVSGVDAVAIATLFAFENDAHERRIADGLRAHGVDADIALSSVVHPEIREYERTLATALNAALQPVMSGYVDRLRTGVTSAGIDAPLRIMQSNGGTARPERVAERPVAALLSGPAAGVQGAVHVGERTGHEDLITLDMGGTSCDVSLVRSGQPTISTEVSVGPYEVAIPMVEIETIGAGGGSIAWLDAGDVLRVGPRSAGANPGPMCYDRGGTAPTVTDAHVLLGRLTPTLLPEAGADEAALRSTFAAELAEPMGMEVEAAAQGIIDVTNATMSGAIRVVSVERGHDPRSFALVAFGGAGPLHAAELAASLDIPRVIVPPMAGVLSAVGLLVADHVHEFSQSHVRPLDEVDHTRVSGMLATFTDRAQERLAAEGVSADRMVLEPAVDLRYVGQSYDVRIPVPDEFDGDATERLVTAFHAAHERRYGHRAEDEPVELVTVRLRATGLVDPPSLDPPPIDGSPADAIVEDREMYTNGRWYEGTVYDRMRLPIGSTVSGPAVIGATDTTVFVPPAREATTTDGGAVIIEVGS